MKVIKLAYANNPKSKSLDLKVKLEKPTGNETSVSFSLEFDPKVLKFVKGKALKGWNFDYTTREGKLGVLIDNTFGIPASTTDATWVTLTFETLTTGKTSVNFGDSPTRKSLSDPQGALLETLYKAGTITIK